MKNALKPLIVLIDELSASGALSSNDKRALTKELMKLNRAMLSNNIKQVRKSVSKVCETLLIAGHR